MDWKSAQSGPVQNQPIVYRWACFSCEHFRRSVLGGLVIDGSRQRQWWCALIDEKKEPCKFEDDEGRQLTAKFLPEWERKHRQAPEALEPRPLSPEAVQSRIQLEVSEPTIPSRPRLDTPSDQKPKPALPNLPRAASVRKGRRPKKRT